MGMASAMGTYADAGKVCELGVGVDVHLDDAVDDGGVDFLLARARATVEDEVERLCNLATELLGRVLLVLAQEAGLQLDIAGLVDTVHVSEGSSNGEVGADSRESGVDVEDIRGLGVEEGVLNTSVVDTILLSTSDANLHLQPETNWGHALEVFDASCDVLFLALFRKVEHVGGEEGLAVLLEVCLIRLEHTLEPREELVCAVVAVHDNGTADNEHGSERWSDK